MSRNAKDYRKAKPIPGTIFDPDLPPAETDPHRHQRTCGLFVLHGVNPMQVKEGECHGASAGR